AEPPSKADALAAAARWLNAAKEGNAKALAKASRLPLQVNLQYFACQADWRLKTKTELEKRTPCLERSLKEWSWNAHWNDASVSGDTRTIALAGERGEDVAGLRLTITAKGRVTHVTGT